MNSKWDKIRGVKINHYTKNINFNIINKRILTIVKLEIENVLKKKKYINIPNDYGRWFVI